MKPLFTVHEGELLVGREIEKVFRRTNVWIPTKDTGIDLLVSNSDNTKTVSLQVKYSRDYPVTDLRAGGWWTLTRQKIEKSKAKYWVLVLVGGANRSQDFIVIKPRDLLDRLDAVHEDAGKIFQSYFWVTQKRKCFETRGLKGPDKKLIVENKFECERRDFSKYLNKWEPIEELNH